MLAPYAGSRVCWRTPGIARPNVFEIDLDAIVHNVQQIKQFVGPDVRVFAAVKANGYGFGLLPVARALQDAGVDALAVADVLDGVVLAERGISLPVLVHGGNHIDADVVRAIETHGFFAAITDTVVAHAYSDLAERCLNMFVEVDVDLERFGLHDTETPALIQTIRGLPKLVLSGVYAHLHAPQGGGAEAYIREEVRRFGTVLRHVRDAHIEVPVAMAASTPELLRVGAAGFNGIDVGRIIYGTLRSDTEGDTGQMQIRQAFASLRSRLVHCRDVREQENASTSPFPIHAGMRIGIAPIGCSDGIDALHCGVALVREQRVPIVGSPSLEHIRLDITRVPQAGPGDEVVFIGRQGASEITVAEVMTARGFDHPTPLSIAVRESVARAYKFSAFSVCGARS